MYIYFVTCIITFLLVEAEGVSQSDTKIVGGTVADIHEFPYQVSIQIYNQHFCGGTVIHPQYVITAAHCLDKSYTRLVIRAGSNYYNTGGVTVPVCSYIIHNKYNEQTFDYDVAILLLCRRLTFSKSIQPILLFNSTDELKSGALAVVSGWGSTMEDGVISRRLLQTSIIIFDQKRCQRYYGRLAITSRMFCAGATLGGRDSCQGDSGGPLVTKGQLVGIVSWGYGCGRLFYPGVYTKVSEIRCWIKEKIGTKFYVPKSLLFLNRTL